MLAVGAGHLTNCKPVAARIFCSAKWWTEGGWKEEVGRVSGIEEDCARNELARGSDLLISYLFCQTVPFHFSRLLSGKTSPVYEHLFFSFSLRNTVWAQVRSIKVREFLFKSNRKHCKRISIDAFENMIICDFFLEKYFLYFFFHKKNLRKKKESLFLMKYDYRYSLFNPYPRMKQSSVDGTK